MQRCLKKNRLLLILSITLGISYAIGSVFSSKILQKVIDSSLAGNMGAFKSILLVAVLFLLMMGGLSFVYGFINKKLTHSIMRDYRQDVFHGVMSKSYSDFQKKNTAEYISALSNDMKMVEENYVVSLLTIIQYSFIFVATTIMLVSLSLTVTFYLMLSVLLMFILPSLLGKILQEKQDLVSTNLQLFTTQVKDILSGFEVIKSFNVLPYYQASFSEANESVRKTRIDADKLFVFNESLSSILGTLCQFVVVFVSAYLILAGTMTAGVSVALIQLSGTFIMPVITVLTTIPKIKSVTNVIKKLDGLSLNLEKKNTSQELPTFDHGIEVEDVSFSYNESEIVLKNINLTLEKGKKYALVGKSGCGKSTLIKLISGYHDTFSGIITIDDQPIQQIAKTDLPQLMATVHQNLYLFDTTIRNNVTLHRDYPENIMKEALIISGIDLFLSRLENGLDTHVGEGGAKLSGGQRQRLVVARALIKQTPVLILDEGTSSIDKQTAYDIENRLLSLDDLTLVTISHTMDSDLLSQYDELIYLEEGQIVGKGSFQELYLTNQSFQEFYEIKG